MKMFKRTLAAFAMAATAFVASVPAAQADVLPIGGPWVVLDETMNTGDFFTGRWTFDCLTSHCKFYITDLFVVSDRFEVYDFGQLIATTNNVPDWTGDPFGPPWTNNPDTAWADPAFSKALIYLASGEHVITIRDIHIPPLATGGPFPDGTVAFRVTVPEPATLALLGIALAGLGFSRRKTS